MVAVMAMRNRGRGRGKGGRRLAPQVAGIPPALSSVVIQPGGQSVVLTFDRAIDMAADGSGYGFVIHASVTGTYDGTAGDLISLSGPSGSTVAFDSLSKTFQAGEVVTIDYSTQSPGNATRSHADGAQLLAFSGRSVTNSA